MSSCCIAPDRALNALAKDTSAKARAYRAAKSDISSCPPAAVRAKTCGKPLDQRACRSASVRCSRELARFDRQFGRKPASTRRSAAAPAAQSPARPTRRSSASLPPSPALCVSRRWRYRARPARGRRRSRESRLAQPRFHRAAAVPSLSRSRCAPRQFADPNCRRRLRKALGRPVTRK